MATYEPPVSILTTLGRPDISKPWPDYSSYGIGPEHIPELIRLLQDDELAWANSDTPDVYAQVHAWRALGQLKAEAAIEPLLDLLAAQEGDDWIDWITEEVPVALAMIGPAALAPAAQRLEQTRQRDNPAIEYARVLGELGKHHPELRGEAVRVLSSVLDSPRENSPTVNGFLVSELLDLKATEAYPIIEKAYVAGQVDESIVGDLADIKWELGLGPRPAHTPRLMRPIVSPTAKERAEQRARKKKAEKRKKKRRG